MRTITVRMEEELLGRVDAARGDVPRERWVRRTLEEALVGEPGGQSVSTARGRSPEIRPGGAGSTPAERTAEAGARDAAPVTHPAPSRAPYVKPFNPQPKGKS